MKRGLVACLFMLAGVLPPGVEARTSIPPSTPQWCFEQAAGAQNLDPILLRLIAAEESSCRPHATHLNGNGSMDHGPFQINSSWLDDQRFRKARVTRADLHDPCRSAHISAWVLASCYASHGNTWEAIGCYNARSRNKRVKYAWKIFARYQRYLRTGKGVCLD